LKLEWRTCFRVGVSAFLLFIAIYHWRDVTGFLSLLMGAVAPLIIGCVAAYLINILMSFYERHYFPQKTGRIIKVSRRPVCMLAAILTLLACVTVITMLIVPELVSCVQLLLTEVPQAIEGLAEKLKNFEWLTDEVNQMSAQTDLDWKARLMEIINAITSGLGGMMDFVAGTVSSVFSTVSTLVIGVLFAVYILASKERLGSQINRLMRNYMPEKLFHRTRHLLGVLNDCFHRFIVGQCIEALILGSLCAVGMLIIRLPYATMIGAFIAFTALIPIAGAYIGAGVGAFMILTVSPVKALVFLVYIVLLQQIEGNLIYPRVVGSSIGLPGIWVLAAITVGGSLLGVFGMLLAVPLVAAAYRLLREDVARRELPEAEAGE
jgi:predicted PurR-regulated permease PerM